ncbi:hypothetical protein EV178_001167 [Coemansia sp. RSA 1646]|nr:hypothetical protein EV178_001167 [Coemansia sp. RSA 1646]
MYRLDLNFADAYGYADSQDIESDCESDTHSSDVGDASPWNRLGCRLLQRIVSFLPRQSDRRSFCMVSKDWALAAEPSLWAYPEFSTPQQLSSFLHVVSDNPGSHGRYIRGIRFTLTSHYDRHLASPYYNNCDQYTDAELPTLRELVQGKHVLSADPALMRPLLHGSDLTSPPLAFRFARMCSPIDSLSVYGFRLRDKHVVNDLMRWNLRELEIIGMPRKPLANLGFLLHSLRSLRSLRIESDQPLPADIWSPLSLRMPALHKLRIWAPSISGSQLLRASAQQVPRNMVVLHLVGPGNDIGDELVEHVVQGSPGLQSLAIHGANITARSTTAALSACAALTYLELVRYSAEESPGDESAPAVVSSRLSTLTLRNVAVQDSLVSSAASVVTQLRALHVTGSNCLTGAPVANLLRASTCLVALGLYSCPLLSENALQGLAESPSAPLVRVVVVENCAMQSDGIERVLTAFPNVEHFTVLGTETLRQDFAFAFNANEDTAVPAANDEETDQQPSSGEGTDIAPPKPLPVRRSFNLVYPPDHFLSKQSRPQDDDIQENSDENTAPVPRAATDILAPRQSWNDAAPRYFVPGLLAFAGAAEDGSNGQDLTAAPSSRRRAATLYTDDQPTPSVQMQPRSGRMRSISDLPSGTDIMASRLDTESAPQSPPEHAKLHEENGTDVVAEDSTNTSAPVDTETLALVDEETGDAVGSSVSATNNGEPVFRALPVENSMPEGDVEIQNSGFAAAAASAAAAVAIATAGYIFGIPSNAEELTSDSALDTSVDATDTDVDADRSLAEQPETDIAQDIAAAMSEDISTQAADDNTPSTHDETDNAAVVEQSVGESGTAGPAARSFTVAEHVASVPVEKPSPESVPTPSDYYNTEFYSADECAVTGSPALGESTVRSLYVGETELAAVTPTEPAGEWPAADPVAVVEKTDAPFDSAIAGETAAGPASEVPSAMPAPAADQPDVDSKIDDLALAIIDEPATTELTEEDKPDVSGTVALKEVAHESVAVAAVTADENQDPSASVADQTSTKNENGSIANAEEPAVEDSVPISSLLVDESVPEESSVISRSLEVPASTDASEVSSAADKLREEETTEAVAEIEEKQEAEWVVESAPVAEELTAEPILATEEPVPVVEQDVQDEPAIAAQIIEEPPETPVPVDEPKAEAAEPVIDTQLAASAEVTADVDDDNPEQSVAEEPVSNPVQEAEKSSEQSVTELVSESNGPDVEPRAVGELSAADALTDSAPTVDESAAASDEPAIPADASETTADSESASRDLQEDTVESVPEENDPSTDTKSIEDPVASLAPVSNDSAVEENPVAPVAVDEKLDTDVGKLSAKAEPVAGEMSFVIDEPETAQAVPDTPVEDIDIGSASTPTSAIDESEETPSNDPPAMEHSISDVFVADGTSAVSVPDEVDTSESVAKELVESPEQDVSERAIAEESPVAEAPAGEYVVQPSEKKESAPVVEVEPVASTPIDDSALGVQGVVESTDLSVPADDAPAPVESVADTPAPVDLDASISDEVASEIAVADEPALFELTAEEQDVVAMDTSADTEPTKETAEPEPVTDSNPNEQPVTSTEHIGTQDVDADRSISDEPAAVDAAPVVEDSAEPVSVVDTPADAAVVIDTSEDLETPAAEPEDPAVVPAADDADAPIAPVTAITEEHAEPPVDSKCNEVVITSEEHVSSSPANEESTTKPVGVEGDVKTDIPVDVVDVQPSDTAEKIPVDAQTVEQAALIEQAAEEPIVSDSFVKESAAQEKSALPDVEDTPVLVTDVVSLQEEEASEKPASDEPAIEDEAHLPAPADHAPAAVDSSVPEAASDEPSLKTRAVEATDADPAPLHAERDIAPAEEPSPEVSISDNSPAEDPVSEADVDPVASPVVEPSIGESAVVAEEPTPEQIEIEEFAPEPAAQDSAPTPPSAEDVIAPASNGVVVEDVVVDIPVAEELAPLAAAEDTITPVAKDPAIPDAAAEDPVVPVSESASSQPLAEEATAEETAPLSDTVDEAVPVATEVPAVLSDAVEAPAAEEIATEKESTGYSEPVPSVEDVASAPTADTPGIEEPAVDKQVSAEALTGLARSLGNNDTTPVSGELAETPAIDESAEAPGSVSNEPISEPLQAGGPVAEMEAAPAAEPVTTSTIVEDVPAPELAVQEPAVQEPVAEESTTEYQHISKSVVEEPTASPVAKDDTVPVEVVDADNAAAGSASLEEAAAPEPSIEEPASDKVPPSAIEKDDLTSAEPAVGDSNTAAEKLNESEVEKSADLHAESEQAVVSDVPDVEDTAAPEIEGSKASMLVIEEPIPSGSAPILDELIAFSSSEAEKVDAPGAAGAEQNATASASETPAPTELADAPAPLAVVGIPAEEAVCSAVADRDVVEDTVIGATEGGPCSEEQAPRALEVDEPATADADDGKLEYVAPAVDTTSTIELDVADGPTDVPEPTEKEPTVDLADSLATGSALKDAVPDFETAPIVADVSEGTPIVLEGTVDEPVPVATAEDDHSTAAPEPVSDEPTVEDVAVMERDISADAPAAEPQEPAKKSTDELVGSPTALALADANNSAPTGELDANLPLETSVAEEAVPDVAEPLAAQDPVVEEASLDVNSATVDQAVESAPAAGIQPLEPSPAVEAPVAENTTHEEAYDKPVDSEDAVVDDIMAETPEVEDASTSAVSIPSEPKIVAESADALDIDNTVPEITPEILVPGDAGVPASLDEELVSRDLATEAVDSDKPDVAVASASEDSAEPSVLDDTSKQVEPVIASSDAELVDLAPSTDSEQHEDSEQPSNLEAAIGQQPNDEHVAPSDIADIASESREPEDKSTADEPSIPAESIAAATEVPIAGNTAATNETAELASDEPAFTERSLEEKPTLPPNEPSADKEDEATEETPSAKPAKEASVDVAPVSAEDATVEPTSMEAIVKTPALVEPKPIAEELPIAEDQITAQPLSDHVETADAQEPTAVGDVVEQSLSSSAGITADVESETDKERDLKSTVIDEPSLLTSSGADMAGIAAGVALATAATSIGLSQHADSIDSQARSIDMTRTDQDDDNDDEGVVDDYTNDVAEPKGVPGETTNAEIPPSEAYALDSEPEMIEYEGSNSSPSSPYELIDSVGDSNAEKLANDSNAAEIKPERSETGGVSPLIPTDSSERQSPPVVVGTIEEVQSQIQEQTPLEEESPVKDEPADMSGRNQVDSEAIQSADVGESGPRQIYESSSLQEPSPGMALSQQPPSIITPDVADWSTPHSQMSYNRTDSQLSLSPPTHTPTSADDENTRSLSKRDSAIYMDKSIKEASLPTEKTAAVAEPQGTDDDPVALGEMPVQGADTASIDPEAPPSAYSAFSTPAFPQYFSHSDASRDQQQQQHQKVGSSILRREVPRASDAGKRPLKPTRPKDVLMELNIETPENGRQLMQLRVTDDLDEQCEMFCAEYNMMDLLPGMKSLVRGKIERRLARRRERALQTAAASAREKNAV